MRSPCDKKKKNTEAIPIDSIRFSSSTPFPLYLSLVRLYGHIIAIAIGIFKNFYAAKETISGIENIGTIQKGQILGQSLTNLLSTTLQIYGVVCPKYGYISQIFDLRSQMRQNRAIWSDAAHQILCV